MKLIVSVVVFFTLSLAYAAPLEDSEAQIVKYESENTGFDGYKFAFETSNGISRSEEAELKNAGTENESIVIRGVISWTAPDGVLYTINFVADENGFQPQGDHIPKK
ncbi:endocuticle structural protein SgAbd-6-like [Bradysia coprophila]|uniref:endocuticle structural protein SgAbd-6-like n=1 Tax=Bradysia coprophila TaxID=38358 RepID=UPI00187D71CD|nr:endocuticle structural protein SgAbd-6-like [Bradysia coprophila]